MRNRVIVEASLLTALLLALFLALAALLVLFLVPPSGVFATAFIKAHAEPFLIGFGLYVVGCVVVSTRLYPPPKQHPPLRWLYLWWIVVFGGFGGYQLLAWISS